MSLSKNLILIALIVNGLGCTQISAQTVTPVPPTEKTVVNDPGFWLGYYTKFRLAKKTFYYGEYHLRLKHGFETMSKIYLRFGATYLLTKKVELTFGIATPIAFSGDPGNPNKDYAVPEFRFWQQVLFVMPVLRAKTYHQLRIEQRWKRSFDKGADFILTYRWRYKFSLYIPLNHDHLIPKTVFFSFYDEMFLQTGKTITYNVFEDNRLFVGMGYILFNGLQVQSGYLWNFHHKGSPYDYENQNIWRIAVYHDFDFYSRRLAKKKARLKE